LPQVGAGGGRDRGVGVTRALHCNLNVVDLGRAAAVYERGLGLHTRMRSRADDADSTSLGIAGPTTSEVWFLYDRRGGRVGPALELAQWERPATSGEVYASPRDVGMQSLGFAVSSPARVAAALDAAGAVAGEWSADAFDAAVVDGDGVMLELVDDPTATEAAFAYVRCNCANLETTTRWYEMLGLLPAAPPAVETWTGSAPRDRDVRVPVQRMTFGDPSGFEVRLMQWPGTDAGQRAHDAAHHRGLYRIALAVDDVRGAVAHARGAGVSVGEPVHIPLPDTPLGGLWIAFLRDPDGVTVELVERPVDAVG
jgi:catechol 2,3-dioxygenase-like lactoylglutathione lyase family enzyme